MTECKQIYPKLGSIVKPGFQCDDDKNHDGNHSEKIESGVVKLTIEWNKDTTCTWEDCTKQSQGGATGFCNEHFKEWALIKL